MLRAVLMAVCGAVLVAAGLYLSPAPWLAAIWSGGVLIAAGLFVDWSADEAG